MSWVIEHLQVIIGVAAAIAYFLNRRRNAAAEESSAAPTSETLEQEERTRQIQTEIRRKIAERRAATNPAPAKTSRAGLPPMLPPTRVPPIDPFGGPMRKILKEIERAAEKKDARPEYDPNVPETSVVLQRQRALQEQMQALEAARVAEQRKAAEIAANRAQAAARSVARDVEPFDLRSRMRDPQELRRAIVLRELLSPPLALR